MRRMNNRQKLPATKRVFDLVLTIVGGVLFSPLFIVIAILVLVIHGWPIIFKQQRPGYLGKPFMLYKFRTMKDLRDSKGLELPDESRLTTFGLFLRGTSLDELPELYNVLRGEMSLVGPRPLLMQYLERYSQEQMQRHNVRPGITGWAQVNGRNNLTWEEKFAMDVWYVDNWSLYLDVKIIFRTFGAVMRREGISQPGQATTEEFMGTKAKGS